MKAVQFLLSYWVTEWIPFYSIQIPHKIELNWSFTHRTHLLSSHFFKAGTAQHKHMDCSYQNLSAEVKGTTSNGSLGTASICQTPIEACHCTVYKVLHYVILYYCIHNTQINSSPGSSKQPDSLGLMAGKESRGDRRHRFKLSVSIFLGAQSSCSPDNDAFISHWDARHVPYANIIRDLCVCLSLFEWTDLVAVWVLHLYSCLHFSLRTLMQILLTKRKSKSAKGEEIYTLSVVLISIKLLHYSVFMCHQGSPSMSE